MTSRTRRRLPDTVPLLAAGLLLLLVAIALLIVGGSLSISHPEQFDFYLLLTGLLVILGSIFLTLLRAPMPVGPIPEYAPPTPSAAGRPAVANPPVASRPAPAERAPAPPAPAPAATVPPRPASFTVRLPALTGSSSIAAQLGNVPPAAARSATAAGPDPQVLAASLPFFPLIGTEEDLPFEGPALARWPQSDAVLSSEVDRLRARVRELEQTGVLAPTRPRSTGPTAPAVEPPGPRAATAFGGRACIGCGAALRGGPTEPLCWGCGRPLCANCYWSERSGPLAHRCPSCVAAGVRPTSVSGGRASSSAPPRTPGVRPPEGPKPAGR